MLHSEISIIAANEPGEVSGSLHTRMWVKGVNSEYIGITPYIALVCHVLICHDLECSSRFKILHDHAVTQHDYDVDYDMEVSIGHVHLMMVPWRSAN